jgi:hypothetical protein
VTYLPEYTAWPKSKIWHIMPKTGNSMVIRGKKKWGKIFGFWPGSIPKELAIERVAWKFAIHLPEP